MNAGTLFAGGQLILGRVWRAQSAWQRARGLLGRQSPGAGEGLIIAPCNGIHTWGMAYAIDAVYFDAGGRILKVVAELAPWRFSRCAGAAAVLELGAGNAARLGLCKGMDTEWQAS